ncbi:hypothetical protein F5Y08DRAFT_301374 [Xylaria arbuscula]|nr:hypothetical protein F5Y08DRAFT_301374 [Xylaria arbuscula]
MTAETGGGRALRVRRTANGMSSSSSSTAMRLKEGRDRERGTSSSSSSWLLVIDRGVAVDRSLANGISSSSSSSSTITIGVTGDRPCARGVIEPRRLESGTSSSSSSLSSAMTNGVDADDPSPSGDDVSGVGIEEAAMTALPFLLPLPFLLAAVEVEVVAVALHCFFAGGPISALLFVATEALLFLRLA